MIPFDLPPKPALWMPPKPAIIRAATVRELAPYAAMPLMATFASASVRGFRGGAAAPGDGIASTFLCHFDGADTSTTFVDEKGHTITAAGNAQLSTTSPKFGTASLLTDGSGDSAKITYAADLLIGTGAFGIDFWFKPTANQTTRALIANGSTAANTAWQIHIDTTTNRINYQARAGAVSLTGPTMSNGTWYHLYFGRSGTTFYYGTDGAGTVANSATNGSNNFSSATDIWIGNDPIADQGSADGRFDEVRMIIGACPWTASYTPPTAPYVGYA